ncbi:MAG: glycosyltransferase [Polyangiales bacterium]
MLVPVERGREWLTERCIAGFPTDFEVIRHPFTHRLLPSSLEAALIHSGAEGFFTCRPRVVMDADILRAVRRHTRRSAFWYLEGTSTFEDEAATLGHLGLFSGGFAISRQVAAAITARGAACAVLPGAVDASSFASATETDTVRERVGFVGVAKSSRGSIVRALIDDGVPVEVVGPGWERLVPAPCIVSDGLWGARCAAYYRSVKVAINIDEWFPMSTSGLGTRPFEILAAGIGCLTNPIDELDEWFGGVPAPFEVWSDVSTLVRAVRRWLDAPVRRWDTRSLLAGHTFGVRMAEVAKVLRARGA